MQTIFDSEHQTTPEGSSGLLGTEQTIFLRGAERQVEEAFETANQPVEAPAKPEMIVPVSPEVARHAAAQEAKAEAKPLTAEYRDTAEDVHYAVVRGRFVGSLRGNWIQNHGK